ncbi:prepilin peptidase, partial [Candidatus Saccharibacteria bacterium]|nr:prepilin peptidase [Candidatus Saccharibacteria bacterium]
SFVNAFVWRLHEKQNKHSRFKNKNLSISTGRSICVHCGKQLSYKDLVPVISWLWLRGRCRYCGKFISDTPFTEVATPIIFILSYIYWPYSFSGSNLLLFIFWLIFVAGFMILLVYDFRWQLLPNVVVYPLMGLGFVQLFVEVISGAGVNRLIGALWGVVFGAGIFWLLYQLSNGKLIGGGDVKLGVVYGILLGGPINALLCIFIASTMGTLVSVPLIIAGKANKATKIPFGPYLIIATIIVYIFGHSIVDWYKNLIGI